MTDTDTASTEAGVSVPKPPRENLFRAQPVIELTRSDDSAAPTLTGHFAVFNQWTEINSMWEGQFMERFSPGAFKKTIAEARDQMRVLFQHGRDPQIGDKPLGPIDELEEDETGARYEVPLLDTAYVRDLLPGLEAGLYGASFRFMVMKEEFDAKPKRSAHNPNGLPERTVTEAQVKEFGPVTFPAYAGATAGLRSITDEFVLGRMLDDPDRLLELIDHLKTKNRAEPDPSGDTTHPDEKPEPSAATTPRATSRSTSTTVGLFTTTRKEQPSWRL